MPPQTFDDSKKDEMETSIRNDGKDNAKSSHESRESGDASGTPGDAEVTI